MKKWIHITCRLLLGLTFVFSGFVKTIDPWGTALKIGEYLSVWGLGASLEDAGIWLGILFCAAELILGLLLVFNVKMRLASLLALAVMGAFSIVTLLSATVLPVGDCGCFGDALHLAPWASFGKNVVLFALAVAVWLKARKTAPPIRPVTPREWSSGTLFACLSVGLGLWCYLHLPLIDFLPFKKGVDLYDAKYLDKGEEGDIALLQFALFDSEGDATHDILSYGGRVYLLCASNLTDIKPRCAERFAAVTERAAAEGARVVLVTSSPVSVGETFSFGSDIAPIPVYNADQTTMITMLRAKTGMVALDGGTIVDKKNCRDIK